MVAVKKSVIGCVRGTLTQAGARASARISASRFSDTPGHSFTLTADGDLVYVQEPEQRPAAYLRVIPNWVEQGVDAQPSWRKIERDLEQRFEQIECGLGFFQKQVDAHE